MRHSLGISQKINGKIERIKNQWKILKDKESMGKFKGQKYLWKNFKGQFTKYFHPEKQWKYLCKKKSMEIFQRPIYEVFPKKNRSEIFLKISLTI